MYEKILIRIKTNYNGKNLVYAIDATRSLAVMPNVHSMQQWATWVTFQAIDLWYGLSFPLRNDRAKSTH